MITEIPLDEFVQDKTNIYFYVYKPEHELATKSGKVYMHRYVMAKHLGRHLTSNEAVHHKDEDRTNNKIDNLELLSLSEHISQHMRERYTPIFVNCSECGKEFRCDEKRIKRSKSGRLFCSQNCLTIGQREFEIDKEELQDLVWSMPTTKIAKLLGVSDVAVAKRCKKLGVSKPPRGYWRKIQTGKINGPEA